MFRAPLSRLPLWMSAALLASCAEPKEDAQTTSIFADLEPGWHEIEADGGAVCSRGAPYSFFVRPGTTDKLVVDFMGGGACWDETTCSFADALFSDDMDWMRELIEAEKEGAYNELDDRNPLQEWNYVIVPYCSGDIHWGDATVTYGEGDDAVTIEHRGATNTRAVLDWVEANVPSDPEKILVTGCSAGAYGSILWTPTVAELYPSSQIVQLGDSGTGVVTEGWFADAFPAWNATSAFPAWIPTMDPAQNSIEGMVLSDLYLRIGAYYPEIAFSQFTTESDANQAFYYEAMGGGDVLEWRGQMLSSFETIRSGMGNFSYYLAPGDAHCFLPYDTMYDHESSGVALTDWLSELAETGAADTIECTECER